MQVFVIAFDQMEILNSQTRNNISDAGITDCRIQMVIFSFDNAELTKNNDPTVLLFDSLYLII